MKDIGIFKKKFKRFFNNLIILRIINVNKETVCITVANLDVYSYVQILSYGFTKAML